MRQPKSMLRAVVLTAFVLLMTTERRTVHAWCPDEDACTDCRQLFPGSQCQCYEYDQDWNCCAAECSWWDPVEGVAYAWWAYWHWCGCEP